ncbi:efflux RND transporter periplasmic adaptor subunit [Patescibacteria group bacterium]
MIKIKEIISKLIDSFKKFPWFIKLIIIAGFIGFSWYGYAKYNKSNNSKPQYSTAKVEVGTIVSTVSASGQVLSVNVISANTKASGIVKNVFVKDGDQVNKGDKILEIDLDFQGEQKYSQAWSSYLAAKNSLELAKANEYTYQADLFTKWDAFKNLAENDTYSDSDDNPDIGNRTLPEFMISQDNWLASEAKYKTQKQVVSQAQVAVTSAWLTYLQSSPVITAPADGTITSLMFAEGMSIGTLDTGNATSNQKIATVQTEGTPVVSVNLSEIDVFKVQLDQKVTIVLDSFPDKTYTGIVIGVDRIGQITSGVTQYPAIIRLDLTSPEILPNMTATANIIINTKTDVLLVPSAGIKTIDGESFVEIDNISGSQSIPVEIGISSDTQTEIISGIKEGEVIITGASKNNSSEGQNNTSPFSSGGFGGMRPHR